MSPPPCGNLTFQTGATSETQNLRNAPPLFATFNAADGTPVIESSRQRQCAYTVPRNRHGASPFREIDPSSFYRLPQKRAVQDPVNREEGMGITEFVLEGFEGKERLNLGPRRTSYTNEY